MMTVIARLPPKLGIGRQHNFYAEGRQKVHFD